MIDTEMLIILAIIVIAAIIWKSKQPDKDGKLPDAAINIVSVESMLKDFKVERNPKLKLGYTEKSIQNQMKLFFQERIQNVTDEYGIEGLNATKIDFNLGNGKVGLELKLAHSVFKRAGQDRLVGQVRNYIRSKYDDENLLVAIYCEPQHLADRPMRKQIEDALDDMDVKILFIPID